jgi:signal transduction histidine kinase
MRLTRLGRKFSLVLSIIWLLGGSATIFTLANHVNAQAEQTVKERAEIVLTAMQAARNYTQDHIQPLVEAYSVEDNTFTQEIIPNFAARRIFSDFRQQDPAFLDYLYKEAAINPTNPANLADEFEAGLYPQMRSLDQVPPGTISGYRQLEGQKFFYLARPLVMTDVSCLDCHGSASDAPAPLLNLYGDRNGFGWNLNEIVATQIMYVPADMIFDRGRQNLWTVTKTFLSVFAALFFTINLLLWRTVIRPLGILTGTAKQISACSIESKQPTLPDKQLTLLATRKDESGQLARAFDYMLYVLRQREQDLQMAVEERTRSLAQEMRDRQTAQSALQIYTHAINHDLRNVVMGISSVVQGIVFRHKQQQADSAAVEQETLTVEGEAIALIQKSCNRQLELMDTLMEVRSADLWRSALRPQSIKLHCFVADLIASYCLKATTATLHIQIPETLPPVEIDPRQIRSVFENLIDNAVKYNLSGVEIAIAAGLDENDPTKVRCRVTDNGCGIDPAKCADLFELYSRGKQRQMTAGFGLGLYICREIIAAHGGSIGVETESNSGVTFWFTLPISSDYSRRS